MTVMCPLPRSLYRFIAASTLLVNPAVAHAQGAALPTGYTITAAAIAADASASCTLTHTTSGNTTTFSAIGIT